MTKRFPSVTVDYPRIREILRCPLCSASKAQGLVACWACYRNHGMKHGNPQIEQWLENFECRLIERAVNGR